MGKKCLEHQTLGQWVICSSNPATQHIILKIVGFQVSILAHHSKNKMEQVSSILYQALFTSHELVLWWHTIVYSWVLIPFEGTSNIKRKEIQVLTENRAMNSENSKVSRYRALEIGGFQMASKTQEVHRFSTDFLRFCLNLFGILGF